MTNKFEDLKNKSKLESKKQDADICNQQFQMSSLKHEIDWQTQEISQLNKKIELNDEIISHTRMINSEKESFIEYLRNQLLRKIELSEKLYSENICEKNIIEMLVIPI